MKRLAVASDGWELPAGGRGVQPWERTGEKLGERPGHAAVEVGAVGVERTLAGMLPRCRGEAPPEAVIGSSAWTNDSLPLRHHVPFAGDERHAAPRRGEVRFRDSPGLAGFAGV